MSDAVLQQLQNEAIHLLDESFGKIKHCAGQLSEQQIWFRPAPALNSIGNLLLHIAGNLEQWVVCGVGGKADTRDRNAEFSANGSTSVTELLHTVEDAISQAKAAIQSVSTATATATRQIQGFDVTVVGAIMHSVPHFVGHTHQVIYITRLQLGDAYQFAWSPNSERSGVPI
jgi:hypothetical protein